MKLTKPILTMQLFDTPVSNNEFLEVIAAEAVVVRADYIENDTSLRNMSLSGGQKIYALKSKTSGGQSTLGPNERYAKLIEASAFYDLIVMEEALDLNPELLRYISPKRRIVSWTGRCDSYEEFEEQYLRLRETEARFHQMVLVPAYMAQCLWPLQLASKFSEDALITYADGALGLWTQILSVFLGSKMLFGNLNTNIGGEAFLTYHQLSYEYGLPDIRNVDRLYGIAGNPVFASLSPLIHNRCYEELGMKAIYLPFHIEDFEDFWSFISNDFDKADLGISLKGFTMVSPFKEETFASASAHLCAASSISKACNILVKRQGRWCSDSSDGMGVLSELKMRHNTINELNIAIIGCGGAGRTIAARLKSHGGKITMYNRSEERGEFASRLLDLPFRPLSEFVADRYDVVVNATPVGKHGKRLIYDPARLNNDSLAIDMAYTKEDTLLVSGCRKNGKQIVEGKQILLHQVKKQFSGLTGRVMPASVELLVREKTSNVL